MLVIDPTVARLVVVMAQPVAHATRCDNSQFDPGIRSCPDRISGFLSHWGLIKIRLSIVCIISLNCKWIQSIRVKGVEIFCKHFFLCLYASFSITFTNVEDPYLRTYVFVCVYMYAIILMCVHAHEHACVRKCQALPNMRYICLNRPSKEWAEY